MRSAVGTRLCPGLPSSSAFSSPPVVTAPSAPPSSRCPSPPSSAAPPLGPTNASSPSAPSPGRGDAKSSAGAVPGRAFSAPGASGAGPPPSAEPSSRKSSSPSAAASPSSASWSSSSSPSSSPSPGAAAPPWPPSALGLSSTPREAAAPATFTPKASRDEPRALTASSTRAPAMSPMLVTVMDLLLRRVTAVNAPATSSADGAVTCGAGSWAAPGAPAATHSWARMSSRGGRRDGCGERSEERRDESEGDREGEGLSSEEVTAWSRSSRESVRSKGGVACTKIHRHTPAAQRSAA
mmetsp:Transcript_9526/g.32454  ORF Transcript_9526/g.32454 Transcript_9526/m.32454 type:complete len:295 (-) Transcript_9526:1164-2048(-)